MVGYRRLPFFLCAFRDLKSLFLLLTLLQCSSLDSGDQCCTHISKVVIRLLRLTPGASAFAVCGGPRLVTRMLIERVTSEKKSRGFPGLKEKTTLEIFLKVSYRLRLGV